MTQSSPTPVPPPAPRPGAAAGAPEPVWTSPIERERSSLGLSPRAAAVLCYAAAWVSGLVLLAFERQSRLVRFHAWQSVLALGGLFALGFALWTLGMFMAFVSTGLFRAVTWISQGVWAVMVVAWLAGLVAAARGTRWRMPVVGAYAERWAAASVAGPR